MRRSVVFCVVAAVSLSATACATPFNKGVSGDGKVSEKATPTRTSSPAEIQAYCESLDGVAQDVAKSLVASVLGSALTGKKPNEQEIADRFIGSVLERMKKDAPTQISGDMDKVMEDFNTKVKGTPISELERRMKDPKDEVFGQPHWRNVQDFLKKECKNDPLSSAKDSLPQV